LIESGLFQELTNLSELNFESNQIIYFDKNSLDGLVSLEKVCLFNNPIDPATLNGICNGNPKCQVYISQKCTYIS